MALYTGILNQVWPDWQIERLIGRGAYGYVYLATRKVGDQVEPAAIKIIPVPQDTAEADALSSEGMSPAEIEAYYEKVMQSFSGEIQMMVALKGAPHIVSVEDHRIVKHENEFRWDILIRMELLTPFVTYAKSNPLGEQEVIRLGIQLCTALDVCHRQNIIHRDIKPQNIFVDRFGAFKLGDFGIARKMEGMTGGLSQKGTYGYIAPEVSHSLRYDMRADIYSLGLVIYQLMNGGRLPFLDTAEQAKNPRIRTEAQRKRLAGAPLPTPSDASPGFGSVIMKACRYDPEERYRSAAEMKADLQRLLIGSSALTAAAKPDPAPVLSDQTDNPQDASGNAAFSRQSDRQPGIQPARLEVPADPDRTFSVRKPPARSGTDIQPSPVFPPPGIQPAQRRPMDVDKTFDLQNLVPINGGNAGPGSQIQEAALNNNYQNQYGYQNQNYAPAPQQYGNYYYGQGMLNDDTVRGTPYEPVSTWGWVGYMILLCIPLIGTILSIVFACGGTQKKSLVNFCRAYWLVFAICMVLAIIVSVAFAGVFTSILRYL